MTESAPELSDTTDGDADKQHGDPLLASAEGRNDGDDGSRHGYDATHPETRTDG